MNKEEELIIKEFDEQQLELLLNDLKDIDKFTGFKNGAFKYELGKYQADLLVNRITKYKEVIDKIKKICNFVPPTWGICGTQVVDKIEKVLKEVE